ncbi:uncharacterized protein LOC142250367 [Anomaloglossus baeobatrachus]|uniref:uncharacterized protein LOC142250367 n=1 Tax=Anomaloglossus baeobatrachus TaxID=238106 RepID=UPI003F4FB06A
MDLFVNLFIFSLLGLLLQIGSGHSRLVVTQPETVTAEDGESVTITCSFTSKFSAYSVTWTIGCNSTENLQHNPCYQRRVNISFPDAVQTSHSSQVPTYEGKTAITINKLTENDSGTFCCHIRSGGKIETGAGTKLEVTLRASPEEKPQSEKWNEYIFYAVIGAEACVIVILIAVVIRNHPRGLSRSKEQDLQSDPSGLQYAVIGKKSFPKQSRPRVKVDAVTYSTVKVNREEHLSSQECELY